MDTLISAISDKTWISFKEFASYAIYLLHEIEFLNDKFIYEEYLPPLLRFYVLKKQIL